MSRVLLIASTTGYQTRTFEAAAREMGHDVILATDRCHVLEDPWCDLAIAVRFEDPEAASARLASVEPDAILAVGDAPTTIAALTAAKRRVRFHSPQSVSACRNKYEAREKFRLAGLSVPEYFRVPIHIEPPEAARSAQYPCVLKPLGLSGSRGVIRANDEIEFVGAFERIRTILAEPSLQREEGRGFLQIETFIPGREFALEGLVTGGRLQTLAIFDKPDPLDGPFFEETIYVTPSREPEQLQNTLIHTTQRAIEALGLDYGPIHAEMRYDGEKVWMLEVAARPIGGLCAKSLRFALDLTLEELIIRHALGENVERFRREAAASGVMMIPIPENGIYVGVTGTEAAKSVPLIEDIIITAKEGQRLRKLPEGASYLGFIFARGEAAGDVESALRAAHGSLKFAMMTTLPVLRPA